MNFIIVLQNNVNSEQQPHIMRKAMHIQQPQSANAFGGRKFLEGILRRESSEGPLLQWRRCERGALPLS